MTATAIAIASVCIIVAAFYLIVLSKAEKPELTDEQLAELSTDKEWWKVD